MGKYCNICKNNIFDVGPNGRKSFDGYSMPRCTKCQSLERHRALRDFWLRFPLKYLNEKSVLQFSHDLSVEKAWFKTHEVSHYGGENSIDIQDIDRPDASYDIINCIHVIEHVADDRKAIKEMMRIITSNGFLVLAVPDPFHRETTNQWSFPRNEVHGHYRTYGKDIVYLFDEVVGRSCYLQITIEDPVTLSQDFVYVLAKHNRTLAFINYLIEINYQDL